ncbi:GntR family transcriptional regulator [Neobacillus cucumis]|uniref:GntR family transcriptional regulator n=1 Tax=Neobacillus cucumis TaxID=1740721 RepID=UPI0018E03AE2|nr:GntR family transcriptional regulator [Neobacillus cucumis]MBI0575732.1 GntR family transcriptional regulator [Neobacillus cucumis]
MKEKTVEKHVYDQIRAAILGRQLAPGKQLVEHNISNTLGVSRTPIRNAIKKLSLEGLVDLIPNRGAFVTSPSKEEVIQAYELRAKLEFLAVQKSMFVMDENDYLTIKKILEDEKESLRNPIPEDVVNANKAFHIAITQKCNNKFLNEFIERLINQTNIYLMLFDEFYSNPGQKPFSPDEHRNILELIQNKDEANLKIALENHFKHSITSIDFRYNGYKDLDEIF